VAKLPWTFKTALELSAALKARKVSAVELARDAIGRIERHDGRINAVCVRDFSRALDAARSADTALARGETRPLLGIPLTVKESFNVAGLPTTWGFPAYKNFVPKQDAVAIVRVKDAGGVILGKTNVPFRLGDLQSYNDIYGTTTTHTTSDGLPADLRADRRSRSPPVMARCRSARISAARCACRRSIAASMLITRALGWCRACFTSFGQACLEIARGARSDDATIDAVSIRCQRCSDQPLAASGPSLARARWNLAFTAVL